jgi:Na+/H+-dicarboxylate symporter
VTGALIAAFIFGIGASALRSKLIIDLLHDGKNITQWLITTLILPLLPFYIAAVFVNLTTQGSIVTTLEAFGLVLLVAISLHWAWLTILYASAGLISGKNGFSALKNMLSAYMTGVGTMSSVATIPVALKQTRKNGVSEAITNFTIPLFANIHLCGSTITITTCAVAVMTLTHTEMVPNVMDMLPFILMLGLVMVAAPGVPGGAVMSALGVLSSMLGFGDLALGLMIALYIAQDSFGTACNVTGDGALAIMIDKFVHKKALLLPESDLEEKDLVKDSQS